MANLSVNAERIAADIEALAGLTEPDRPYTRRAFTPIFLRGREFLESRFRAAGLETRIDAAGNLIGRREGTDPSAGTIMIGSHSDTVPDGGRFDGVAGVVAALEVVRALGERGTTTRHAIEIVDFLAEEVSIFGVSCIGSRGMAGVLPPEWLDRSTGDLSLREGFALMGGDAERLDAAKRHDITAFLELHIEQGPVLEDEKIDIGVVTAIAGITRIEIEVEGRADHAGTTPMASRRDALTAASELVLGIEALGRALAERQGHFAATVGEFSMTPNAANVVPSHVRLLIDARAEMSGTMDDFVSELTDLTAAIAKARDIAIAQPRVVSTNRATPCAPEIIAALDGAARQIGASHRRMASGAGHDTAFMARIAKAGMIFVPCRNGRSHAPDEWAETDDIALGAAVLLQAALALDEQL